VIHIGLLQHQSLAEEYLAQNSIDLARDLFANTAIYFS
jgi:hypothetical protein